MTETVLQTQAGSLERQIGGRHYTALALRPTDFALANGWDAAAHQILKYVTRHVVLDREKGIESLRKALHLVEIRQSHIETRTIPNPICLHPVRHTVGTYCAVNAPQIGPGEQHAIMCLGGWVYGHDVGRRDLLAHRVVWNAIEEILIKHYGVRA